ncbi:MAG: hypothetical protein TR69_WS6001000554 [candidate division WS6 bacterium OLB20]|uniref:MazG nucleotide pyrophosphohydrolase domain protein n=1 Tax=candidate division WS6 bacterium OLB20 TaxID=1617426 RepID=A0A136LY09_9BACT|nr:MAG: hypothetical protein TR69_WS6001000554 [candidate division WS6 bacterium OLB20]
MPKSIQDLTDIVCAFADERGWANNDPNQLISSILIELGELAEHYQWKSRFPEFDKQKKLEVGYEFVDILFYLLQLAAKSGIDIEAAFDSKLPKLHAKFPVGQTDEEFERTKEEYRRTGKNKLYS